MAGKKLSTGEILSDNRMINCELPADADQIRISDVVPLSDLHVAHSVALTNAAEDIAGSNCVNNVVAVVYETSIGILPVAGHILEFFLVDVVSNFCNLYYLFL